MKITRSKVSPIFLALLIEAFNCNLCFSTALTPEEEFDYLLKRTESILKKLEYVSPELLKMIHELNPSYVPPVDEIIPEGKYKFIHYTQTSENQALAKDSEDLELNALNAITIFNEKKTQLSPTSDFKPFLGLIKTFYENGSSCWGNAFALNEKYILTSAGCIIQRNNTPTLVTFLSYSSEEDSYVIPEEVSSIRFPAQFMHHSDERYKYNLALLTLKSSIKNLKGSTFPFIPASYLSSPLHYELHGFMPPFGNLENYPLKVQQNLGKTEVNEEFLKFKAETESGNGGASLIANMDGKYYIAGIYVGKADAEYKQALLLTPKVQEMIQWMIKADAVKWYQLATEQNDAQAQYKMGRVYEEGIVVPQSLETAKEWYERAAAQKHPKALYKLGKIEEAAALGYKLALHELGQEALAKNL